jgi:peptidoglycan/LPS O-acetylase OafA/YrhL
MARISIKIEWLDYLREGKLRMTRSQEMRVAQSEPAKQPQRLAWLEGIRIFAAVVLLFYHAQLLFTKYSYTPQPTGLGTNLTQLWLASQRLGQGIPAVASLPIWFGYQFVDVFVLISGFSLVLSLKGKPLQLRNFLTRRFLRILIPFWAVAWLSYPVLWIVGHWTNSYVPDAWHAFASMTFPALFDYGGDLLLPTNGPWWFVPLILSFTLIFPILWYLLQRWGAINLFIASSVVTFVYRALAVWVFNGHPTYAIVGAAAGWQPFVSFIAKLSSFVLGMLVAQQYLQRRGAIFWRPAKALVVGLATYAIGFICQFYRWGWIFDDFLLAVGLTLCCMVIFRALAEQLRLGAMMAWLGLHSYSYFLIHNFVVDRTVNLFVQEQLDRYQLVLLIMAVGTLVLAVGVDRATPWVQRVAVVLWRKLDRALTLVTTERQWTPKVGDAVVYQGRPSWRISQVEKVVHDKAFYLCQISDGQKKLWVNYSDLSAELTSQRAMR